jgi:hypothetical protein
MPKLRVHNFSVSVDGYAARPDQNLDNPLGVGGMQLHNWAFAIRRRAKRLYEIAEFVGTPAALHVRVVRRR